MAAQIRPVPGKLWRPTREGSRAKPRIVARKPPHATWGEPGDVWFKFETSGPYSISIAGWHAWVRKHAAIGELHTGDP